MDDKQLTEKQRDALKNAAGIAAGYERYRDHVSLTDEQENKARHEDESYGIASGYEKLNS